MAWVSRNVTAALDFLERIFDVEKRVELCLSSLIQHRRTLFTKLWLTYALLLPNMGLFFHSLQFFSLAVSAFASHHHAHLHQPHHRDPDWAEWSTSDTPTSSSTSLTTAEAASTTYSLSYPSTVTTSTSETSPTKHLACKPNFQSSAPAGGGEWGSGGWSGWSGGSGNGIGVSWPSDLPTFASNGLSPAQSSALFQPIVDQRPLTTFDIPSGAGALSQLSTNGQSPLGTLQAPKLGPYRSDGTTLEDGFPWGGRTAKNANPYKERPSTGNTRSYVFNVARGTIAPDGVEREVLLINNQFPAPTIEANWGDTISVTVTNSITGPEEGTSLHWHGLLQTAAPYMDGVPGIQQVCISVSGMLKTC